MPISDNILNTKKKSYQNTPLFLGEKTGLLDSINKSHPELFKIYKDMKQRDWDEQEHSFASCNTDFKTSPKSVYDMMIRTLAWQWEADSVAAHNTLAIMAPFVSNTELWLALTEITKNECLTGDHEVLTPTGWKRIDEVTTDDKVAQWDPKYGDTTFVNPIEIVVNEHDGIMYKFSDSSGLISQIVTPKHRMPVIHDGECVAVLAKDVVCSGENYFPVDNGFAVAGNRIEKSEIHFKGLVHCLTVPTGYFMVRHNGVISVTGNCLHGLTYSEIVRGSFDNPDEVLQEILSIQASFKRLEIVAAIFEKAYNTSHKYALGQVGPTQETYNDIFMMMCALLVLERIQFMASFAITFAICDTGIFAPIGVNVQKICQDELDIHVRFDKYVIRSELQTERGKVAFQQLKPQIQELIDSVTLHEIDWTMNDLFSEGRELIGVEAKDVCDWVKLCSKDVYDVFGLVAPFGMPAKHNLTYLKRWIDMGASQASPQEQRNSAYLLGGFVDDLGEEIIDF